MPRIIDLLTDGPEREKAFRDLQNPPPGIVFSGKDGMTAEELEKWIALENPINEESDRIWIKALIDFEDGNF